MNDNWDQRKGKSVAKDAYRSVVTSGSASSSSSHYSLENIKRDYRLTKQKIHAGLWVKEIEKLEVSKLGDSIYGGDNIEKLLDSAPEIFDSANNNDFGDPNPIYDLTFVVTGSTYGIGKEIARQLAEVGGHFAMAVRNSKEQ